MHTTLKKCEQFLDMQVWSIQPEITPRRWLSNFFESELEFAYCLLDALYFFNEKMCNHMLFSAFQAISLEFKSDEGCQSKEKWEEFCQTAIFTCPDYGPSASGNLFLRKVRQVLGIDESNLLQPTEAMAAIHDGKSNYLVFVDDFVGSGLQFTETWMEPYCRNKERISFPDLFYKKHCCAFYIPFVASQYGISEIGKTCSNINILPAHLIDSSYSAISPESHIWPEHLKRGSVKFLEEASCRAGYKSGWKGFHDLGLTIAFSHGIPDATLPIFYSNKNGWKPLMEKS